MLLFQLRFKASMVNGGGTFWHACAAWALSTCQHHTSRDCSAWGMQEEASWDPNRDRFQSWITQYVAKSKTYKLFFVLKILPFPLTALIIEFTRLITTPRGNFISLTENHELTFDGCTMTFVDGCTFMVCILLLCSSTVSPAQEMWQTVAYWKLIENMYKRNTISYQLKSNQNKVQNSSSAIKPPS